MVTLPATAWQAVTARTGQAFIDGQTSNEAQFKYLMNNALASKTELNLSVGVSLTAEQVAALTHDIVWMENAVVNGETVLVPVVYLAQASGRLGPTGALIAGNDVTLIAGQNLDNVGTLKAANNLSATAGNDLVNSGLIQAGNRLDLLAGNTIVNKAGGIIAGRDVSVTAVNGDVLNERTVTSTDSTSGQRHTDYTNNAARIEAANDLSVQAGRDINNLGSTLQSGRDLSLSAGRDVNIAATKVTNSLVLDRKHTSSDITQLGATVTAGRDLSAQAGRDLNVIASSLDAKRDVALSATENLSISSAADEQHSYSKSKKVTRQEDHVSQVASTITSGSSVALSAGQDLTVTSSRIEAANEAYLVAGGKLALLSAEDSDYSLYDKKKKGSFGAKKTKHDEVTDVTNVGTEIKTGGDLLLVSGGDQTYQAAKLDSGKDLTLNSGGAIAFEGVKDLHQESHTKSNSNLAWNSAKGKGKTDEILKQSELVAQGEVAIHAVDGLNIDVKQVNQQTVSQAIDAMVKADPQLAWLKDAEQRGDVDWRQVKEIHDSFKYSQSGLGVGAQLALAIAMAVVVGPAAMGALASTGTAVAAGGAAVATAAATTASSSLISNQGDLGAALKDTLSKEAIKGYAISGITAGLTAGLFDGLTATKTNPLTGKVTIDLGSVENIGRFAANQVLQNATSTALSKALGQDASFGDALLTSMLNTVAATSFNAAGDLHLADGSAGKIALHALIGGVLAEASGSDFLAGAVAAGANEALATELRRGITQLSPSQRDLLLTSASQLVGLLSAAVVGGDAKAVAAGAWIAKNATQYNFLDHYEMEDFVGDMQACNDDECYKNTWTAKYGNTTYDQRSQDNLKDALGTVGPARAKDLLGQIQGGLAALGELKCPTETCNTYKFTLIDRALTARASLDQTFLQGQGIVAGVLVAPLGALGGAAKGTAAANEANSVQKAYAYWAEVRDARVIAEAAEGTKNFSIADRVFGQLNDPRMGQLAGKLDASALQRLANNPSATRFMDARTGHINVIQEFEGKLIRITVPRDEMKIISVGPIRANQVKNLLGKGDFISLP